MMTQPLAIDDVDDKLVRWGSWGRIAILLSIIGSELIRTHLVAVIVQTALPIIFSFTVLYDTALQTKRLGLEFCLESLSSSANERPFLCWINTNNILYNFDLISFQCLIWLNLNFDSAVGNCTRQMYGWVLCDYWS